MPVSEKERFLEAWEQEFKKTMKVLKEYPEKKLDLRPHEKSRSAKELAWVFTTEEKVFITGALKGEFDFANAPKPPGSLKEILSAYEKSHKENVEKIRKASDADMNRMIKFMTGPKTVADMRTIDVLWGSILDAVHHRGQFSVYLRMAGGKVPSIYGPSADEPWM